MTEESVVRHFSTLAIVLLCSISADSAFGQAFPGGPPQYRRETKTNKFGNKYTELVPIKPPVAAPATPYPYPSSGGFRPRFGRGNRWQDPWGGRDAGSRFRPGFGPGFGPGFVPGFGPGFVPGFGPGFVPGFGPGFGPGLGPAFVAPGVGLPQLGAHVAPVNDLLGRWNVTSGQRRFSMVLNQQTYASDTQSGRWQLSRAGGGGFQMTVVMGNEGRVFNGSWRQPQREFVLVDSRSGERFVFQRAGQAAR